MLNYSEVFNIEKTTLPVSKSDLQGILSKKSFMGFVQCPYNRLVDTLKEICEAEQYEITVNPEAMYANGNNPFHHADCVIKVEGLRSFDEFADKVVSNEDSKEWTDFVTYSETFKDEIKALKVQVIQKCLWNAQNISNWFSDNNFSLPPAKKEQLTTDWEAFKNNVLLTGDLYSFIDSCDEGELQKAASILRKNLVKKLEKYRSELDRHVNNNTKREEKIIVKNPVINRIFIVSNYARQCEKDWPKINFTSLDRRSFETLSLWNEA